MTLYNDSQKYEYSDVVKQYVGNLRYSSRFYPPIVYLSLLHSYWSIALCRQKTKKHGHM